MSPTTVMLKVKYPYIFAKEREKGRAHTNTPVVEAALALDDDAPADVTERLDFDPQQPGLHYDARLRAVTQEAAGNAYCLYSKDGSLRRVWWRIGAEPEGSARFAQLQEWAEQYARQAALASRRV